MPRGQYPRTPEQYTHKQTAQFGLKMQKIARESVELWPYKKYTCTYCGVVFESRSHRTPFICQGEECLREYHAEKLREWREKYAPKIKSQNGLIVEMGDCRNGQVKLTEEQLFEIPYHMPEQLTYPRKYVQYVYFIMSQNGLIKIGCTGDKAGPGDPEKRYRRMSTLSPVPLALLGYFRGEYGMERKVHQFFSEKRRHGEWFELSDADLSSLPKMFPDGSWGDTFPALDIYYNSGE